MNNQTVYWIWLQQLLGYGSTKTAAVMKHYTFAEDFYRASLEEKIFCLGENTDSLNFRDVSDRKLYKAERIIRYCRENDIDIVAPGDEHYPKLLMNINAPPAALYVKGDTGLLCGKLNIAIVGTRAPSVYGKFAAHAVSAGLSQEGATIVSGGAKGIDTVAHKSSLNSKGSTVCVLGCGIGYDYLKENEYLREMIAEKGALVSEYIPLHPTGKFSFPLRNRIISGISKGVVVIEAGKRSGSLITAREAVKQSRKLYALRNMDGSPLSDGTEALIAGGAAAVREYSDILDDFRLDIESEKSAEDKELDQKRSEYLAYIESKITRMPSMSVYVKTPAADRTTEVMVTADRADEKKQSKKAADKSERRKFKPAQDKPPKNNADMPNEKEKAYTSADESTLSLLTDNARSVLDCLSEGQLHIDNIAYKTGLPVGDVSSALTELELFGMIQAVQGNVYCRL